MAETVIVPARFNGPPANGNGGYSAGIAAAMLEGPVEATLRRPVPLDRPLAASVNGGAVALLDGEDLIVEAREVPDFEIEVPEPVGPAEAREAMTRYRGLDEGPVQHLLRLRAGPRGQLRGLLRQGRGARRRRLHLDPAELDRRRGRPRPARVRLGGARLPHLLRRLHRRRGAADQLPRPDHGPDRVDPDGG